MLKRFLVRALAATFLESQNGISDHSLFIGSKGASLLAFLQKGMMRALVHGF